MRFEGRTYARGRQIVPNFTCQIGEGSYGDVMTLLKDGTLYAIKRVRMSNTDEGFQIATVQEVNIYRHLDHKNIVRLIGTEIEGFSIWKLIFEYMPFDLAGILVAIRMKFIQDFSTLQIASMFKDLLSGLDYCHSRKIVHSSIKPSNILASRDGTLKIGDGIMSRIYQYYQEKRYVNRPATIWYRSPELLLGEKRYKPSADVWSLGCVFAEMFTKNPIFSGKYEFDQLAQIFRLCGNQMDNEWPEGIDLALYKYVKPNNAMPRRLKEEYQQILPEPALKLLNKMLVFDPKRRVTASEILADEWLKYLNTSTIVPLKLPTSLELNEFWAKKVKTMHGQFDTSPSESSLQLKSSNNNCINEEEVLKYFRGFNSLVREPTTSRLKELEGIISTISEESCLLILQQLHQRDIYAPKKLFRDVFEKLIATSANAIRF